MPRQLIKAGEDKRYVRRNAEGELGDVVDVGRSLATDRRLNPNTVVEAGDGARGDQKPRPRSTATAIPTAKTKPAVKGGVTRAAKPAKMAERRAR